LEVHRLKLLLHRVSEKSFQKLFNVWQPATLIYERIHAYQVTYYVLDTIVPPIDFLHVGQWGDQPLPQKSFTLLCAALVHITEQSDFVLNKLEVVYGLTVECEFLLFETLVRNIFEFKKLQLTIYQRLPKK
jgi:hypothetical protein